MLNEFGNGSAKIEKYRRFWSREPVQRPIIGFSEKNWFPVYEFAASRKWGDTGFLEPAMIEPEEYLEDQERILSEGLSMDDDIIRGACPHQGIGWLCGMLGCRIRLLPGSTLQEEKHLSWDRIENIDLDPQNQWYEKYFSFALALAERAAGRYPVSHGTLTGPSDLLALFRGSTQHIFDVLESPAAVTKALMHFAEIIKTVTERLWQKLPKYENGYFDAQYQLWAPGPILRLQEDALSSYSPEIYREVIRPVDEYLSSSFTCSFMHLHTTELFALDDILSLEQLRCIEINHEPDSGGPDLPGLLPFLKRMQKAGKSLVIRGTFSSEELETLLGYLDPAGLYIYIMIKEKSSISGLRKTAGM